MSDAPLSDTELRQFYRGRMIKRVVSAVIIVVVAAIAVSSLRTPPLDEWERSSLLRAFTISNRELHERMDIRVSIEAFGQHLSVAEQRQFLNLKQSERVEFLQRIAYETNF